MAWKKSSPELIELHEMLVSPYHCVKRKMFGFQVFFVNGNMFSGIYEDGITLRLSPEDKIEIMDKYDEVTPFTPLEHEMKEYVVVPEYLLSDNEFIYYWMERSYAFTASLQPKTPKSKAKGKAKE